jgi:tetratricopeptide (TPR) repeat protein
MSLLGRFLVRKKEEAIEGIPRTTDMGLHPLVSTRVKKDIKLAFSLISGVLVTGAILGISAKLITTKISENKNKDLTVVSNVKNEEVRKENEKKVEKNIEEAKLKDVNNKNITESNVITKKIETDLKQNSSVATPLVTEANEEKNEVVLKELLNKAQMKEIEGDIPQAIILYKKALVLDPNNINILYKLALLNLRAGYYSNAIKYADKILQIKKDFVPAILVKGKAYEKQGMLEKAQAILEEAFFFYPHNKDLIETLGELYEKQGDYLTAQDYYKMLADLGYMEGYLGLARINEKIGNLKEAYKYYKKIYENPNISDELRMKVGQKLISLEEEQNDL